ncbi:MAG TPA: hypothetical protein VMV69_00990 [Pirellulales bacterium]|nr:hypothetical protein [Pirellulales bacterium]
MYKLENKVSEIIVTIVTGVTRHPTDSRNRLQAKGLRRQRSPPHRVGGIVSPSSAHRQPIVTGRRRVGGHHWRHGDKQREGRPTVEGLVQTSVRQWLRLRIAAGLRGAPDESPAKSEVERQQHRRFADLGYGVLDTAMVETAAYCLRKGLPEKKLGGERA